MDQQVYSIIEKYYRNECSPEEVRQLLSHFNTDSELELLSYIMKGFELERKGFAYDGIDKEALDSVYVKLEEQIRQTGTLTGKQRKLWPLYAGVAAAVAVITLGVWLYTISNTSRHPEFSSGSQYANDVKPGKNTATITLANGKTITLSDKKTGVVIGNDLTYNDGSTVANLSPSGRDGVAREGNSNNPLSPQGGSLPEGERSMMLTASTPRGGTYQVTLPDGTHVWLNADSKISFPSQFSGKQRKILLSGEAYFEVSQNKRIPFIVESKGQQVEVLGTHFNINAYNDQASTKTTLLEGSVRVAFGSPSASRSSLLRGEMASAREGNTREGSKNNSNPLSPQVGSLPRGERSIVLKPSQQANTTEKGITVTQVDATDAIAWKNGSFAFQKQSLRDVMRSLARWYNVEIIYNPKFKDALFTGSVSRFENISTVLHILEGTGKVNFKVEGRKVFVME